MPGNQTRWDYTLSLIKEYLSRFGKWPAQSTRYKGIKIGMWCSNQRSRKQHLTAEQISQLNSIGFTWKYHDPFYAHFKKLVKFRADHPDLWPSQTKGSTYSKLACWCNKQRQKAKAGTLKLEHRDLLDSISFPFNLEWERNFEKLQRYVKIYSTWPRQRELYEGIDLGGWCAHQRYNRKQGILAKERIQLLESIEFPWSPYEEFWQRAYDALLDYRKVHPEKWPSANEEYLGIKLGSWCVAQRQAFKKNELLKSRRRQLNQISFPWEFEAVNLTDLRFSRLRVLKQVGSTRDGKRLWICLCSCGKTTKSTSYRLTSGKHKSCGCLLREKAATRMNKVQKLSAEKRRQTANQVQLRIDKVHGAGTIILIKSNYKDVFTPATFMHWIYGEWKAKPISVYRGSSHPEDGRKRTNLALEARRLTEEEIDSRLPNHVRIKPGAYVATSKKATFVDLEYGEWDAVVSNVLGGHGHPDRGAQKQLDSMERSNLQKYGVKYVAQVAEFALKAAEKQNKITKKQHWKTNATIQCQGGWEVAVVDYLNKNRIEYEWQPKVFLIPIEVLTTPKGSQTTYRPDFYLLKEDMWIEIKGYFRDDAIKKWAWFCETYSNAELWDYKKLRSLGIIG